MNTIVEQLDQKYREEMPANQPESVCKIFYTDEEPNVNAGKWIYYVVLVSAIVAGNYLLYLIFQTLILPEITAIPSLIAGAAIMQVWNQKDIAKKYSYAFALTSYGNIYIIDSRVRQLENNDMRNAGTDTVEINYGKTMQFFRNMYSGQLMNILENVINGTKTLKELEQNSYSVIKCNSIHVLEKKKSEYVVEYWDEQRKKLDNARIGKFIADYEELVMLIDTMNRKTRKEYAHRNYQPKEKKLFKIEVLEVVKDPYNLVVQGKVQGTVECGQVGYVRDFKGNLQAFCVEAIHIKDKSSAKVVNEEAVIRTSISTNSYSGNNFELLSVAEAVR